MMRRVSLIFLLSALAGCVSRSPAPVSAPADEPLVRTARLLFVGDVMSHTPQVAAAKTPGGYDYTEVFSHFHPIFDRSDAQGTGGAEVSMRDGMKVSMRDGMKVSMQGGAEAKPEPELETITVANLETTLRTAPPYTGYPTFAAPAELAFAMRRAGIDIATTANNHICDKGAAGIRSTLAILDSAGVRHTGAFLDSADWRARNPLSFTAGGMRFALFAYTYGTNGIPVPRGMIVNLIDTVVIARDLALARSGGADCVIVSYHWGEEYSSQPARAQRELAAWTHARGAHLVIGGHPHVVQPVEARYGADSITVTGATYYSLGNFVSNQRRHGTDGGIAAEIAVRRVDSLPVAFDPGWRLAWVHTPYRDGVRRYEVLPAAALDTLPEPARTAAQVFALDARALLADSVFTELQ